MILETERLYLREMTGNDYSDLCEILMDEEVMYAYEHGFSPEEVSRWLNNQLSRYNEHGFGLWAVINKESGEFIGQCGLTMQNVQDEELLEIGYLFKKKFWHSGYASEAAAGCRDYAFDKLGAETVYSIIRDTNAASQNVARRTGMKPLKTFIKHYYDMDMPHILFGVNKHDL